MRLRIWQVLNVLQSVTWGASVSVSAGFDAKVPFLGGSSLTIEQTLETSGEHTKSLEEMEGTETTTGAFAHQYMQFYVRKKIIKYCVCVQLEEGHSYIFW